MDAGGRKGVDGRQRADRATPASPNAPTLSLLTGPVVPVPRLIHSLIRIGSCHSMVAGPPSAGDPHSSLLSAVLQTLLDEGPNPTSFHASPAADFVLRHGDSRVLRSAPGWWIAYGWLLEVSHSMADDEDTVTLSFFAHEDGAASYPPAPWRWELSYVVQDDGTRRVVLRDHASYPSPLINALSYHAIGKCREALLERTAARLGQRLDARMGLRANVVGVLATIFGKHTEGRRSSHSHYASADEAWADESQPMWQPREEPISDGSQQHASFLAPTPGPSPMAWAVKAAGAHADVAALRALDETPPSPPVAAVPAAATVGSRERASRAVGANVLGSLAPMSTFYDGSNSSRVPSTSPSSRVNGAAGCGGALATAEAFARACAGGPSSGPADTSPSALARLQTIDDRVDSLRARMPNHSTETLREMVRKGLAE